MDIFDRFVITCLIGFVIGCVIAYPSRGSLSTPNGIIGAIIATLSLILIALHYMAGVG